MPEPDRRRSPSRRPARSAGPAGPADSADSAGSGPRSLLRRAVLPSLAVLLMLWTLTCLVGVAPSGLADLPATAVATLAGAAPVVTLLAVPLITLAARRRSWATIAVAAVAALLPWVFVAPYASGDQTRAAAGDATLRVMVVNAHEGRASARDIAAAAIGNEIDLLVVTELSGSLAHDLTMAGLDRSISARWVRLPGQGAVADDPQAGMGVWGRFDLDQPRDVEGTQWPAMTARVTAGTTTFTLVAAHVTSPLPDDGRRWAQDLSTLRTVAATGSGPTVMLANLNATPWHADFRRFARGGLRDAADALGRGPRPTWPTWSPVPVLSLDHAMIGGGVGVDSVQTVVIGGSDHRGLIAALRLPTPG